MAGRIALIFVAAAAVGALIGLALAQRDHIARLERVVNDTARPQPIAAPHPCPPGQRREMQLRGDGDVVFTHCDGSPYMRMSAEHGIVIFLGSPSTVHP